MGLIILRWIVSAVALVITVHLGHALGLPLEFRTSSPTGVFITAMEAALAIGFVNAVIRPIVDLIALPITCLTLGLFSLVVNALMFELTSKLVPGFRVDTFWAALFGSLVLSAVSGVLEGLLSSAVEREEN